MSAGSGGAAQEKGRFSAEERAAIKQRAAELKADGAIEAVDDKFAGVAETLHPGDKTMRGKPWASPSASWQRRWEPSCASP